MLSPALWYSNKDNMYKDIRKKISVILKSPASGGKIEDRLTKVTIEAVIEELEQECHRTLQDTKDRIHELQSELIINTK